MLTYDTRILIVMLIFSLVIFKISKTEWKQVGTVFKFILLFLCLNIVIVYLFSPFEGCSITAPGRSFSISRDATP